MTSTIDKEPRYGQVIHRTWTSTIRFGHTKGSGPVDQGRQDVRPADRAARQNAQEHACVGKVIRARRRDLGITQEELAARVRSFGIDMRQSDISRIEQGKVALPRFTRLQCIADALSMPVGEFLARAGWVGADEALGAYSPDSTRNLAH